MLRVRQAGRNCVVGIVLTAGLVSLVFGLTIIGLILVVFGLWQVAQIARGKGGLFVDQTEADKPGKPILRSK